MNEFEASALVTTAFHMILERSSMTPSQVTNIILMTTAATASPLKVDVCSHLVATCPFVEADEEVAVHLLRTAYAVHRERDLSSLDQTSR